MPDTEQSQTALVPAGSEALERALVSPLASVWGIDAQAAKGISRASGMAGLRHGFTAGIPIVCKGPACPYVQTCYLDPGERPLRGRCPIEIASLIHLFEQYCASLEVGPNDVVDLGLIKELVDIEIQIMRADNKMASDSDFVEEVTVAIDQAGKELKRPELVKAVDYKERLRRERHRILNLLNSTRKDRQRELPPVDPSSVAAALIARAAELQRQGRVREVEIIDVTPEKPDIDPDTSEEEVPVHGGVPDSPQQGRQRVQAQILVPVADFQGPVQAGHEGRGQEAQVGRSDRER